MTDIVSILKYLFLISLHAEHYEKAFFYLQEGFEYVIKEDIEYIDQMWTLFEISYWFKSGKLGRAESQLKKMDLGELRKDKQGWAIGLYYMDVLISLEQNDTDKAAYKLARFERYLSSLEKKPKRMLGVVKVLDSLLKYGMDFQAAAQKREKLFAHIQEGKGEYFWNPLAYELVEFSHWFNSKLR
jgi:hypothetical protein